MAVVNVALDPRLGVPVGAAEAIAQREAETLFEDPISAPKPKIALQRAQNGLPSARTGFIVGQPEVADNQTG